jgi:flagellar hook-associated protein 2
MGLTPLAFSGISQYSQDFQTILQRAVDIASLPVKSLQNDQAKLVSKSQLLGDLGASIEEFAAQLNSLTDLGSSGSVTGQSGSPGLVAVSAGSTASPGLYVFSEISEIASAAAAATAAGLSTAGDSPLPGAGSYLQLVVGGQGYDLDLTPDSNNLNSIRDMINSLGAGVTASVLSTGTAPAPYFLSISATATGQQAIELRTVKDDAGSSLLEVVSPGSNAHGKINGKEFVRSSNSISDLVEGVTFTLQAKTTAGESVPVTLSSTRNGVESALESLLSAYNSLIRKLDAQVGETAGLLSGDSVVSQMSAMLRELMSARGSENGQSLPDLGVRFDNDGIASLDAAALNGLNDAQWTAALRWLSDASSGLAGWNTALRSFTDPVSGLIAIEYSGFDETGRRLSNQVSAMTERIQSMQRSLFDQLQAADALLARLNSQQSILTASLESLNLLTYGKRQDQ